MATITKDPNRLEEAIKSTRGELDESLAQLKGVMEQSLDWRTWVRRHPAPALGLAFVIGLRLGRGRWI